MSTTTVAAASGAPAGFLLRLVATIIDTVIIAIPLYILQIVVIRSTGDLIMGMLITTVIGAVASILYWGKLESGASQATLGKKVMKIKVTSKSGGQLDFAGALKRNWIHWLGSFIMVIDILLGLSFILSMIFGLFVLVTCIAVGFKKNKQGFHDDWAEAEVVRA